MIIYRQFVDPIKTNEIDAWGGEVWQTSEEIDIPIEEMTEQEKIDYAYEIGQEEKYRKMDLEEKLEVMDEEIQIDGIIPEKVEEINTNDDSVKEKVDYFISLNPKEKEEYIDTLKNKWIPESANLSSDTYKNHVIFLEQKLLPAILEANNKPRIVLDINAIEEVIRHAVKTENKFIALSEQENKYCPEINYNPTLLKRYLEFINTIPKKFRAYIHIFDINNYEGNPDTTFDFPTFSMNLKDNLWDLIPDSLKEIRVIKKVEFKTLPDDEGIKSIHKEFSGRDVLKISMLGTNFDERGVASTDGHKILFTKRREKGGDNGTYCFTKKCFESTHSTQISERFPDYQQAIASASSNSTIVTIDLESLRKYIFAIEKAEFTKQGVYQSRFYIGDMFVGFNIHLLLDCVEGMLKMGYSKVDFSMSSANRGALLTPIGKTQDAASLSTDFVLLMPVMINTNFEKGEMYYDLNTECVVTVDIEERVCLEPFGEKIQAITKLHEEIKKEKDEIVQIKEELKKKVEVVNEIIIEEPIIETEPTQQDYLDAIESLEAYLSMTTGKEKKEVKEAIDALKIMIN